MGFIIGMCIFIGLITVLMILLLVLSIRKLIWAIRYDKMSSPYRKQEWKRYKERKRRGY